MYPLMYTVDKWACNACINDGVIPDDLLTGSSRTTDESAPAPEPVFNETKESAEAPQSNVSGGTF